MDSVEDIAILLGDCRYYELCIVSINFIKNYRVVLNYYVVMPEFH